MIIGANGTPVSDAISTEAMSCIFEAAIRENCTPEEIADFVADSNATSDAVLEGVLLEKNIVRLDKKAKLQNAYKTAIFTVAKEDNDRDYKKLVTVWKMERALEAKLEKKYKNEGMKRAKEMLKKSKLSKVPIIGKLADKASK
jgi:sensor histidine kinase regulating citrate/malate metabolism